ncbi:MAG: C40 family peptidase [Candidatus Omnitrophota bacterium]
MVRIILIALLLTISVRPVFADEPFKKLPPKKAYENVYIRQGEEGVGVLELHPVAIDFEESASEKPAVDFKSEPAVWEPKPLVTKPIEFAPIQPVLPESETVEENSTLPLQDCAINNYVDSENPIAEVAKYYLGTRYRRGGTDKNGVDCSGLVVAVWRDIVPDDAAETSDIPRKARDMYKNLGVRVEDKEDLKPGDLVFFYKGGRHVGIYAGPNKNGEPQIIQASSSKRCVVITPLSNMPPVYGIKRIFLN